MGGGTALYWPGDSAVHRLPPQVKLVCALLAVLCVVATPRSLFLAFGVDLLVLLAVWTVIRVPPGWFAKRALIELPFVLLALLLPFVGSGERRDVLGLSISVDGALAGWNIAAKGTLGVLVSLTLAATTHPRDLLAGLQRLRVPATLTMIAGLMLRYVEVIVAESARMRTARVCRGHDPRFLWQAGATARGIGTLFLRSYERGERVHRAMLSRGWTGALPEPPAAPVPVAAWLAGIAPALVIAGGLAAALWAG